MIKKNLLKFSPKDQLSITQVSRLFKFGKSTQYILFFSEFR